MVPEITNDFCNVWYSPTAIDKVVTGMLVYINVFYGFITKHNTHWREWVKLQFPVYNAF